VVLSCSEEGSQSTESSESDSRTADMEHGGTVARHQSRVRSTNDGGGWRLTRGRVWEIGRVRGSEGTV